MNSYTSYKKIKILGTGTYGTVYLCKIKNKNVVLKEINNKFNENGIKAANNEIQILKTLNHPNIIQYHQHYISKHFFCIIMEYAFKGNLHEYILKHETKYISQKTVLNIFCQILLGLDYIHSNQIIHRDLKCENILITGLKQKIIKIADFGISKLLESEVGTRTVIGTPNYLAPEVCAGQIYGAKCDVWALGCVLFEMCARERMFEGPITNVILSISQGHFKQIDFNFYDFDIQQIIEWCLTVEDQQRPDTSALLRHHIILPISLRLIVDLGRVLF